MTISGQCLGETFVRNRALLETISGAVVITMAVYLLATLVVRVPSLFPDLRFHPRPSTLGPIAARRGTSSPATSRTASAVDASLPSTFETICITCL